MAKYTQHFEQIGRTQFTFVVESQSDDEEWLTCDTACCRELLMPALRLGADHSILRKPQYFVVLIQEDLMTMSNDLIKQYHFQVTCYTGTWCVDINLSG